MLGTNALQVVVATSPSPILYWDDNNGHKSSAPINGFPATSKVLIDDIALASNGTTAYTYITCRELTNTSTTNLYIITYRWDLLSFQFILATVPTLIDTRPTSADILDGIRVSTTHPYKDDLGIYYYPNAITVVWQKGGQIKLSAGTVNLINGTINFNPFVTALNVFLSPGTSITPLGGSFSNPDVSTDGPAMGNHISITAINNNNRIVTAVDEGGQTTNYRYSVLYTLTSSNLELRTPRLVTPLKYTYVVTFNELDVVNKKSNLYLIAGNDNNSLITNINSSLEQTCTNNTNYKLTGFPSIAITQNTSPPGSIESCAVEVAWQQITCNGTDFCTIQALSKRYDVKIYNSITNIPLINNLYSNQYFYLSNDLTKNSFFPSVAGIYFDCKNFYSFDIMDKTTNANGLVGYKQSNCNGSTIREAFSVVNKSDKITAMEGENYMVKNKLLVYPNPANNSLTIENKENITKVEMYNNLGNIVKVVTSNYQKMLNVEVGGLVNGQYLLKVYSKESQPEIRKITIQH
jgi:hypothetical protein